MGKKKDDFKKTAQHIWLAGLGALSEAQEGSEKLFDALVAKGQELQKGPLKDARKSVKATVKEVRSQAEKAVGDLESSLDRQVSRALKKMGVATKREVSSLKQRISDLENELKRAKPRTKAGKKKKTAKRPARKAARKTTKKKAKKPTKRA